MQGGNEVLVKAARGEHVVARTLREGSDSNWQSRPRMRTRLTGDQRPCARMHPPTSSFQEFGSCVH